MLTGKPFSLEIVTPEGMKFTGQVEAVTVPGATDPFQVLYNHAPIVSALEVGMIKFNDSQDNESIYATSGGFVQVLNNKVVIAAETIEDATSIDVQRAEAAKQRAEERMRKREEIDTIRAEHALKRSINRLKIAQLLGRR